MEVGLGRRSARGYPAAYTQDVQENGQNKSG